MQLVSALRRLRFKEDAALPYGVGVMELRGLGDKTPAPRSADLPREAGRSARSGRSTQTGQSLALWPETPAADLSGSADPPGTTVGREAEPGHLPGPARSRLVTAAVFRGVLGKGLW